MQNACHETNVDHTQRLHYGQFLNDRSFLHHSHHSKCQSHSHHNGEAFWDSCHSQAKKKSNDATLKRPKSALHVKPHASWEHMSLCWTRWLKTYLTPMVNMSRMYFPWSHPTIMITPENGNALVPSQRAKTGYDRIEIRVCIFNETVCIANSWKCNEC